MAFLPYALHLHMMVRENMEFGMPVKKVPQAERRTRSAKASRIRQQDRHLDRKPSQLSRGQRQRVAIGQASAKEPKAILFAEPLSTLDAKLRVQMREEVEARDRDLKATMIHVTDDQVAAMTMADNLVVAGFIGTPAMHFLDMALTNGAAAHAEKSLGPATGCTVHLSIRPEHITFFPVSQGQGAASVLLRETPGRDASLYVRLRIGPHMVVRASGDTALHHGAEVEPDLPATRRHHFAAGSRSLGAVA